jgi:hypothetical protein
MSRMGTCGKKSARRVWLVGLMALALLGLSACRAQKESRDEVPKRDINSVMADHTTDLMAIPGVTGVAIGELDDHTPCILVLVEKQTDQIERTVPRILEGHPVRLLVSGKIVPMKTD